MPCVRYKVAAGSAPTHTAEPAASRRGRACKDVTRPSLLGGGSTELVASDEAEDAEPEVIWEVRQTCFPIIAVCRGTPAVHEPRCDEEHGENSLACARQAKRVSCLPGLPVELQLHVRGGGSKQLRQLRAVFEHLVVRPGRDGVVRVRDGDGRQGCAAGEMRIPTTPNDVAKGVRRELNLKGFHRHCSQGGAPFKCAVFHSNHRCGDAEVSQGGAIEKGSLPNSSKAIWKFNTCQGAAVSEATGSNGFECGRHFHGDHARAAAKRAPRQSGNLRRGQVGRSDGCAVKKATCPHVDQRVGEDDLAERSALKKGQPPNGYNPGAREVDPIDPATARKGLGKKKKKDKQNSTVPSTVVRSIFC